MPIAAAFASDMFGSSSSNSSKFFVCCIESELVNIVCDDQVLDALFYMGNLFTSGCDDEVDGVDVGRSCLAPDKIDIDVLRDVDVLLCYRLKECRLKE